MQKKFENVFWGALGVTFVMKLVLSAAIPITSDEAYFQIWATHLDFGYYDHPPMVGWMLYLINFLGDYLVLLRLPAVLFTSLIGLGIYLVIKRLDANKAVLIGTFYLISPYNMLNVLISTDTPVIFFVFVSVIALYLAEQKGGIPYYLLSGVFLGCAFLSKYFSAFLALSYIVYFFLGVKSAKRSAGFLLLFAVSALFLAVNVWWNYTHLWANVMFNVFNRNKAETFSLVKPLLFIVSQAYLVTPPVVYYLYRNARFEATWLKNTCERVEQKGLKLFAVVFLLPLAVFAVLSLKKVVGLHWVLAFYPFMYILLVEVLSEEEMIKSVRFMFIFTAVHFFLIGAVLSLPVEVFKNNKNYDLIVMGTHPKQVLARLEPYRNDYLFSTPSYSDSAILSYHSGRYFFVFGGGSHHARQDDIITDFRGMDSRNIMILKTSVPDEDDFREVFDRVRIEKFSVKGADYYVVLGGGFKYAEYRHAYLAGILRNYYNIPYWLPMPKKGYFFDKYFPDVLED
ncbi:MAG: glycosyltransferase family 39 protein [Endomicrobiales bacterium]|nr:glycosyltransferase family 39 protein [Endomicrobiales bacterium]